MTKTLGLIGSGMIGGVLARLAVDAGLDVALSNSRGPATLGELVADLGPRARAVTPAEAAAAGDLVVATVPLHAYDRLPADVLAGRTVIDTMNYYPERDGHIARLDQGELTSSELVQRHLAGSRVVKAANNMFFLSLLTAGRPAGSLDRSALPVAGDDDAAKAEVAALLDILGYDSVDTGSLADSWRSEPGTPVYVMPYFPAVPPWGSSPDKLHRWFVETEGAPVTAGRVRSLIDRAVRIPIADRLPT
ncbi:NADPH-dependent F420 reductase [Kutzneria sp. 744]|uniref:NADPH-dependent F420 reductase n=1 Tax=Kutzneria sp. (strain 744) TaxID=345341 RepID=UPI0003EED971|nr:NAD(P)-binding domain-containing protein [Kutzneria sp. 744]EWM12211.1 NADP oxidoreductase coenzyme F420-dependent [Kutzneria sp. 744]